MPDEAEVNEALGEEGLWLARVVDGNRWWAFDQRTRQRHPAGPAQREDSAQGGAAFRRRPRREQVRGRDG